MCRVPVCAWALRSRFNMQQTGTVSVILLSSCHWVFGTGGGGAGASVHCIPGPVCTWEGGGGAGLGNRLKVPDLIVSH